MIKIIDYKLSENNLGKGFVSLKITAGLEPVQSRSSGKFYLKQKSCYIPSTIDVASVESVIGTQLPGKIERVACEPYSYTIEQTGEVVELSHRYEYQPDDVMEEVEDQEKILADDQLVDNWS